MRRVVLSISIVLVVTAAPPSHAMGGVQLTGDVLAVTLPAGAYGATFAAEDPHGRPAFYKSFATAMGVTFALKKAVDEERPDHSGSDSFPSGHAAASFEGAAFIQRRYGWKYGVPAYLAAVFVGYSRVASDRHYVHDVIAGGLIGLLSSYVFTRAMPAVNSSIMMRGARDGGFGVRFSAVW